MTYKHPYVDPKDVKIFTQTFEQAGGLDNFRELVEHEPGIPGGLRFYRSEQHAVVEFRGGVAGGRRESISSCERSLLSAQ